MALNRDNFTARTIDILAKRVGYICSNPSCRKHTVGPNSQSDKSINIGIAAHITAASIGGPRFDENLTIEQRKGINNGIWLCANCATLIDRDSSNYTVENLNEWKKISENEMNKELSGNKVTIEKPYIEADLIWANNQRWNRGYSNKNKELYGNVIVLGEDKPLIYWDLIWNFNIALYNNSRFPAFNIKIESASEVMFSSIDSLSKINNLPPYANLELKAKSEYFFEGTSLDADKLLQSKFPENIQGLKMVISYNDEEGKEYSTLFTIIGEEIKNEKQ